MNARDPNGPVALFDSGVGGLTVLHECLVSLPHEDFLYLGDTARFPYGTRKPRQLQSFAIELTHLLLDAGAKLIVIACNSATSAALQVLQREYEGEVRVIGVVRPESRLAASASQNRRIGLLATPATVASGAYERALAEVAPDATLHAVASAELAPLIQAGGDFDDALVEVVERAVEPLAEANVDTVILGCTHYPLVRPILQRALGRRVRIVSSGEAIAEDVEHALQADGLARPENRKGDYRFMCTGDPHDFHRIGGRFLQMPLGDVNTIEVHPTSEVPA